MNRRNLLTSLASIPFVGFLFGGEKSKSSQLICSQEDKPIDLPEEFHVTACYKLKAINEITYEDEKEFENRFKSLYIKNGKICKSPLSEGNKIVYGRPKVPTLQIPNEDGSTTCIPLIGNCNIYSYREIPLDELKEQYDLTISWKRDNVLYTMEIHHLQIENGKIVKNTFTNPVPPIAPSLSKKIELC